MTRHPNAENRKATTTDADAPVPHQPAEAPAAKKPPKPPNTPDYAWR